MNKLFRQIRREAVRSPKKAAVLGLLALVAVWFWAPLVLDWVRGDGPKKANAATAAALPLSPDFAAAGKSLADTAGQEDRSGDTAVAGDWQEVIAGWEADPKTGAAAMPSTRDPFVAINLPPPHESPGQAAGTNDQPKENIPELTPQDVGLELTSTLVGPGGGLALIGGKTYRPQEKIVVAHAAKPIEFTLAEVHPRRAVLLREGKSYNLTIPRADGSEGP